VKADTGFISHLSFLVSFPLVSDVKQGKLL